MNECAYVFKSDSCEKDKSPDYDYDPPIIKPVYSGLINNV